MFIDFREKREGGRGGGGEEEEGNEEERERDINVKNIHQLPPVHTPSRD